MPYNPDRHHRRSIRLRGYDYTRAGAYFITICIQNRNNHLFGNVVAGEMRLNDAGMVVEKCWNAIPEHFPHVELDEFVIMPNHLHGIIHIVALAGAENFPPGRLDELTPFRSPSRTVGSVIRGFKIGVTKWIRKNTDVYVVWQRDYYEHIIRDDAELNRIRRYIANNPRQWGLDPEKSLE